MNKVYRIIILAILVFLTATAWLLSMVLRSSDSSSSTGSGTSPMLLMIIIAGLVIVIVPGIFVITRLAKR